MSKSRKAELEARLADLPPKTLEICQEGDPSILAHSLTACLGEDQPGKGRMRIYPLYPGIELTFLELIGDHACFHHDPLDFVLEINFCRSGRVDWSMGNQTTLYLGPGDFSIHSMALCADSKMTLPAGYCEGVTVRVDIRSMTEDPPELLRELGVTGQLLRRRFCDDRTLTTFSGGETKNAIFASFFDVPEDLRPGYYKLKVQELLLCLCRMPCRAGHELSEYRAEQVDTIKEIHNYLMEHMDRRISIEELSRLYLMNTTTLKTLFKTVYGSSIAAHIKEHRMERAARLLQESKVSVAEIARSVGYESQSKFTVAFKEVYGVLPSAYRKGHHVTAPSQD